VIRQHGGHATPWDNERAPVKVRDVIKMLEDDGWTVVRQRGSHRQFKHTSKPGLVTVAGKPGDELAPGTLNSVRKQAGLKQ
jgi:predicted RNA binding protein YcfA (HicA-like mRNA interferase family)